jgi:hypothetical protein
VTGYSGVKKDSPVTEENDVGLEQGVVEGVVFDGILVEAEDEFPQGFVSQGFGIEAGAGVEIEGGAVASLLEVFPRDGEMETAEGGFEDGEIEGGGVSPDGANVSTGIPKAEIGEGFGDGGGILGLKNGMAGLGALLIPPKEGVGVDGEAGLLAIVQVDDPVEGIVDALLEGEGGGADAEDGGSGGGAEGLEVDENVVFVGGVHSMVSMR